MFSLAYCVAVNEGKSDGNKREREFESGSEVSDFFR